MSRVRDGGVNEKTLVERLRRRDPQALSEVYDRFGAALYSRMWAAAGQRRAAEDLVVEVLLRAWNRIHAFDPDSGPIELWLMAIARETAPQAPEAAGAVPPSPKLKRRVLAAAGFQRFGWAPFLGGAAVLAISAAVYFGGRERTFAIEVLQLREQIGRQNVQMTRIDEALSILNANATTETSFDAAPARGKVFINARQGILLIASNFTPPPPGKVYEMWLFPKSGRPAPAGLVQPRRDGTVLHVDHEPVDAASIESVGLTLENQGGASQPGSPPLILVRLH